jgi:hypothetical protein
VWIEAVIGDSLVVNSGLLSPQIEKLHDLRITIRLGKKY